MYCSIEDCYENKLIDTRLVRMNDEDYITDDQDHMLAYKLFRDGRNLFITGGAGVGKSHFIRNIRNINEKVKAFTSTTGISSILIYGTTIHSWSGIGYFDPEKNFKDYYDKIKKNRTLINRWKRVQVLIIDEISMIHPKMLELLDYLAKAIRLNSRPMGGIQLLLVGDFFQLPSITNTSEKIYAFEIPIWNELIEHTIEFKHVYRQNEKQLMDVLNKIRIGKIDNNVVKYIKLLSNNPNYNENYTHLFPTKKKVQSFNTKMLNKLEGEPIEYKYEVQFKPNFNVAYFNFPKDTLVEENLIVKKGAFVMVNKNIDFENKIVNGTQGFISGFTEYNDPIVEFSSGYTKVMFKETWEYDGYTIRQYPLMLAWAITTHKSQGSSIEKLSIDIGNNIFEEGQSYVALSRCTSSKYLHISNFDKNSIMVNQKVLDFYNSINQGNT